jgi:hypothetical protein
MIYNNESKLTPKIGKFFILLLFSLHYLLPIRNCHPFALLPFQPEIVVFGGGGGAPMTVPAADLIGA